MKYWEQWEESIEIIWDKYVTYVDVVMTAGVLENDLKSVQGCTATVNQWKSISWVQWDYQKYGKL